MDERTEGFVTKVSQEALKSINMMEVAALPMTHTILEIVPYDKASELGMHNKSQTRCLAMIHLLLY